MRLCVAARIGYVCVGDKTGARGCPLCVCGGDRPTQVEVLQQHVATLPDLQLRHDRLRSELAAANAANAMAATELARLQQQIAAAAADNDDQRRRQRTIPTQTSPAPPSGPLGSPGPPLTAGPDQAADRGAVSAAHALELERVCQL